MLLEEMRGSVLKVRSKIIGWKKAPGLYLLGDMLEQILGLCKELGQKLDRFFTAFVPFLKEAKSDENVLLYLVENRHKLNSYLGEGRIEKILLPFEQLRTAIHEGYTRRKFIDFYTKIEPLIDAIEWQTA